MQFFTFLLEQLARISSGLQCISEIRQPHEPEGVLEVFLVANVKSDPARIGNPVVLFSKSFRQERIANWAWEGYVNDSPSMHVSNFCFVEEEFTAPETVRMN